MTLLQVKKQLDPTRVSPSRLNSYVSCGIAFHLKYVQDVPPERSGSAALFGSVMHKALEFWGQDRSRDLTQLVRDAWVSETVWDGKPTAVTRFLKEYQQISVQVIKAEHAARTKWEADPRNKGKKSQAPRMTKYFKESEAARKLNAMLARWLDTLNEESPWKFSDRDPLPSLYDESLVVSKRYAHTLWHLPNIVHSEFEISEAWRGFTLTGYIDFIEPLIDRDTKELLGVGIGDYKTYRKEPAEHKDWRQVVMYDAAVRSLVARGAIELPWDIDKVPLYVGIDYVRGAGQWFDENGKPTSRRYWQIADGDYERLERELNAYKAGVEGNVYLPAEKNRNPDFCDYGENCCLRSTSVAGGSALPVEVNI